MRVGIQPELDAGTKHKTALVIGSEETIGSALEAALSGWHIERVADNVNALALIERRAYDLVVTGVNTSGREDVELLRKMRLVRPHIRLIILTSESTPADVIAAMRERAFSYFSRSFSVEALSEMIRLAAKGPCWDDGIEVISATPEWIRIVVCCEKGTADRLARFIDEISDLPEQEKGEVASAFREMLLNAIEHGGHFDASQYVEISYVRARHAVMCRIKDPGEGFSLDEINHAAVANPPDDPLRHQVYRDTKGLRPGGFGVLITRSLVDELIYSERGNEVILVKYVTMAST